MAEMDMGFSPNNNKKRKKKKKQSLGKSLVTGLFPCKGDSGSEIARKIIFLGSLCLMIAALVIIAVYFIALLKPEEAPIGTNVVDQNGSQVIEDGQMVVVNPNAPTKEQIEKLPEGSINEEYATYYEANNDFVGWVTINGTNVDYPVVQGILVLIAALIIIINFVVDLLYGRIDPRIRIKD